MIKEKKTNNDRQNITQKAEERTPWTPLNTGDEHRCCRMVNKMCNQYSQNRCEFESIFFKIRKQHFFAHLVYRVVTSARSCNKVGHLFWFTILAQHETKDVILYIHSVHEHKREIFSTSKLQDEIKTEKFELNKFHASKKDPFY
jgi:hypothetical protein